MGVAQDIIYASKVADEHQAILVYLASVALQLGFGRNGGMVQVELEKCLAITRRS
jgi:hypothetical protein